MTTSIKNEHPLSTPRGGTSRGVAEGVGDVNPLERRLLRRRLRTIRALLGLLALAALMAAALVHAVGLAADVEVDRHLHRLHLHVGHLLALLTRLRLLNRGLADQLALDRHTVTAELVEAAHRTLAGFDRFVLSFPLAHSSLLWLHPELDDATFYLKKCLL